MHNFLFSSLTAWRPLGYAIVFLGMVLEGEAILFIAAFLANQGFFDVGDLFITAFSGVALGDLLWYWLGVKFYNSSNFLGRWLHRLADPLKVDEHLIRRTLRTIIISKFAYGLHHIVLIHAGASELSLKKFVKNDLVAIIPWLLVVGGLGYLSSASFYLVRRYLRAAEIVLILVVVLFVLLNKLVSRSLQKKI